MPTIGSGLPGTAALPLASGVVVRASGRVVVVTLDTVEAIRSMYLLLTLTQWMKELPGTLTNGIISAINRNVVIGGNAFLTSSVAPNTVSTRATPSRCSVHSTA